MRAGRYKYHVFVSHAVEDKLPVANELCSRLEQAGLCIWYSGKELRAGDSLERTILKALDQSEYGIVILSPTYVERNWPMKEYYLLLAKEIEQGKVILPVFYNITAEDLLKYDIAIADRWAISYKDNMDHVVQKLLEVIKGPDKIDHRIGKLTWRKTLLMLGLLFISLGSYVGYQKHLSSSLPSREFIKKTIEERVRDRDFDIEKEHEISLSNLNAKPATIEELKKLFADYANVKTNYRNAYELQNGFKTVQSRRSVEAALRRDLDSLSPAYSYNLSSPNIFLATKNDDGRITEVQYMLRNTQPLSFAISDDKMLDNGEYEVSVSYKNNLRYMLVGLYLPKESNAIKKHQVKLKGYLPVEKYVFEKKSEGWVLIDVR